MPTRTFRFIALRALLILVWDVYQRHWPSRAQPVAPAEVEHVMREIREYLENEE